MRIPSMLVTLAMVLPVQASGQARFGLTVGATAGTRLIEDRIFQAIRVTQSAAPTITLGATLPVSRRERAGVEVALGLGKSRIHEAGLATANGPDFTTLGVTFGFEGPLFRQFTYRCGAGLMKYLASKQGFFRQGGPLLLVLGGGVDFHLPLRGPVGLLARLRYDYQRFSTDELRATGFARTQDVHRIGAGLGIEFKGP